MTEIEQLPPDQRAALSLLLRRRKRYEEVASTLGIAPSAVHDRAHAALAAIAPEQARALDGAMRERIGELLLGQQDGAQEAATRAHLADSQPAREWAQAVASELTKLAPGALPEIPDAQPPISRRGGAILLAGIVAIAAVVVALVLSLGGHGGSGGANQAASRSGGAGAAQGSKSGTGAEGGGSGGGGSARIEKIAQLKPVAGGSAKGAAAIASEGGRRALILNALQLPPTNGFSYVVWLIGAHGGTTPFGRAPAVGKNGRIRAVELLTVEASAVSGVEITRETSLHPSAPGIVVLKGSFVSR